MHRSSHFLIPLAKATLWVLLFVWCFCCSVLFFNSAKPDRRRVTKTDLSFDRLNIRSSFSGCSTAFLFRTRLGNAASWLENCFEQPDGPLPIVTLAPALECHKQNFVTNYFVCLFFVFLCQARCHSLIFQRC